MGKILALDIGEKRIGLAITDETKFFAFPLKVVSPLEFDSEISEIVGCESIEKIIVGLPRNMDGSIGFQAEKVKQFSEETLKRYADLIEYEDETVTSIEAKESMKLEGKNPEKHKTEVDAYAAKIILDSYLRRQ